MTTLVAELGKKLADRWLGTLVLPGLLFVAVATCGRLLGHGRALRPGVLPAEVDRLVRGLSGTSTAFAVAGLLLAATAAGVAARAVAAAVRRVWTARRPRRWVAWRHRRALAAAPERLPVQYLPARATPVGDRFRLVDERVAVQFGLSVVLAWPRLWLLVAEPTAAAVRLAAARYRAATETTAWGVLYLVLGAVWWPAAVVGAAVVVVGYRQSRVRGGVLADVVEATVDVHQKQLAEAVGVDLPHGRVTPAEGLRINDVLNKRA
ncbi:hypothetical protein [Umezawaea tangerina]|uniref:Uncharacterized protein n=1 Tax=Umezawaea tangerina TaxID=84725 RepID=A0A2T0SVI7_9PSEU|nr:hypothetical protein [Umezawaea tangerina]PRY37410.1 hypothetical protein CLV43_110221 [Umezawaea tangerina]